MIPPANQKSFTKWVEKKDLGAPLPRFDAEFRCGSFPHSGLGWGCHRSVKNYEKHATALVTMGKGLILVMGSVWARFGIGPTEGHPQRQMLLGESGL